MARIKLPSYLKSIHGSTGDMVMYSYFDKQYARSRVTPRNPNTAAQIFVRRTFGDAVRAWQVLSDDEKRRFNKKGRMRSMNGYNLFISEYMKERMPALRSGNENKLFRASTGPSSPVLLRYTSVPSPLLFRYGTFSPPPDRISDKIPA